MCLASLLPRSLMGYSNSNSGSDSTVQTISFLRTTSNAGFEKCARLLSAARLPFWEEPGRFGYRVFLRVRRFGHRVLLRVFPLVRKLGQMLLQLLAVRNLFLGQWRLKRFWRRRRTLPHHRRRFRHCRRCWRQNHSSRCWWHSGLLERDSPRLLRFSRSSSSALHSGILFSLLELFLPTLDLLSVFQGLGHSL